MQSLADSLTSLCQVAAKVEKAEFEKWLTITTQLITYSSYLGLNEVVVSLPNYQTAVQLYDYLTGVSVGATDTKDWIVDILTPSTYHILTIKTVDKETMK